MKTVTQTRLRTKIYEFLDEVLETGLPLEIYKEGEQRRIVPVCLRQESISPAYWDEKIVIGNPLFQFVQIDSCRMYEFIRCLVSALCIFR